MKRKTHEEFVKEIARVVGDDYAVLGKYTNSMTKVEMIHKVCGTIFYPTPNNFKKGSRCPECSRKAQYKEMRKTNEEFLNEFKSIFGDEYTPLTEYTTSAAKVQVRHNSPNCEFHTFYASANNLLTKNSGCPKCANNIKKDTIQFKDVVFDLVGSEYEVLGEYVNTHTKISMKHNTCGHEYLVTPKGFSIQGRRCPSCNESKGEASIRKYLFKKGLKFLREYSFEDCKLKGRLRFDFAIVNASGDVRCLIEFDGEQHFKSKSFFGGDSGFEDCKKRDRIKDSYCKTNNIPLIRIPYWEIDNVERILDAELPSVLIAS